MPVVKIRTNRQVTIPKTVFDAAHLKEGGYVEITREDDLIVMRPKALVDADDILTSEEEELVRKGEEQLRKGESVKWDDAKKTLGL